MIGAELRLQRLFSEYQQQLTSLTEHSMIWLFHIKLLQRFDLTQTHWGIWQRVFLEWWDWTLVDRWDARGRLNGHGRSRHRHSQRPPLTGHGCKKQSASDMGSNYHLSRLFCTNMDKRLSADPPIRCSAAVPAGVSAPTQTPYNTPLWSNHGFTPWLVGIVSGKFRKVSVHR